MRSFHHIEEHLSNFPNLIGGRKFNLQTFNIHSKKIRIQ